MKNEAIPRLRFRGFVSKWIQSNLNKVSKRITKGTSPKDKSNKGPINFIKINDINKYTGKITIHHHIHKNENYGRLSRSILKNHDILFSIAGTLGRVALVSHNVLPANTNQALAIIRLRPNILNISFLMTFLRSEFIKRFIYENPTEGAQPNLSLRQVGEIQIRFPPLPEQQLIGKFFAKLDKLIQLQQKKVSLLKKLKRGYLQKLFPRKGESVPRIRFKGFHDKWNLRIIRNIAPLRGGYSFKSKDFTRAGVPIIRISNILNNNITGKFKFYKDSQVLNKYILSNGAILIAMSGATAGKVAMLHSFHKYYQNQRVGYFKTKRNVNNYFIYLLLQSDRFYSNLKKIEIPSHPQPNLSSKNLNSFKFLVPNIKEQCKIGNFFKHLDNYVNFQKRILANLRKLKKAYLQKMFC